MELVRWMSARDGIVHRNSVLRSGFTEREVRAAIRSGAVRRVRRHWLATAGADAELLAAAEAGGRVACVSLARRRRWWMPDDIDARRHFALLPHARPGLIGAGDVVHWTKPVAPGPVESLEESIEDALAHIALCASPESARVLWESAIRVENLSVDALRRVCWTTRAARELAEAVTGLCDSGLESTFLVRLGPWGQPIRQQVILAGRPVDFLIGEFLVVQIDGYAHHSSAAQRGRDVRHDAELRLRGYTVLRFTYAHVLHDWPSVERTIARAVAAGLHLRRAA
ncbi:MAG: DUF559 domain-containing protein [Microbacterium sp.]|uniref:endonuclease domain-containing protein n=1 Tax=Microbacterium sp. TaxID=51671 RepID=UPI0039E3BC40